MNSQHLFEENQRLISPQIPTHQHNRFPDNPFICNICRQHSLDPFLTVCGHLFCWTCLKTKIHSHNHLYYTCSVCAQQDKLSNGRMIFGGNAYEASKEKPKPQNLQPIRNPTGVRNESSGISTINYNVNQKKRIAGYGMMPPMALNVWNIYQQNEDEERVQKQISVTSRCIKSSLCLVMFLAVLGVLFNNIILW